MLDEKSTFEKNSEELQHRLSSVAGNQSKLQDNLTSLMTELAILTNQVTRAALMHITKKFCSHYLYQLNSLNSSVSSVLTSLINAPQLKTVPDDIVEIKKDLAQFGSRLTDVENEMIATSNGLQNVQKTITTIPTSKEAQVTNVGGSCLCLTLLMIIIPHFAGRLGRIQPRSQRTHQKRNSPT